MVNRSKERSPPAPRLYGGVNKAPRDIVCTFGSCRREELDCMEHCVCRTSKEKGSFDRAPDASGVIDTCPLCSGALESLSTQSLALISPFGAVAKDA